MYITRNGQRIDLTSKKSSDDKNQPTPQPNPNPEPKKESSSNIWIIFLIVLLVVCGGLWIYNRYSKNTQHGRHRQF